MKKIYCLSILACLTITAPANCIAMGNELTKDERASAIQRGNNNGQQRLQEPGSIALRNASAGNHIAGCDSLTTIYNSDNGLNGVMIKIISFTNITITGFNINCTTSGRYYVYYKAGGFDGFYQTPGAWTILDSADVISNGTDVPSVIGITNTLPVIAGDTMSLYIFTSTSTTKYTDDLSYSTVSGLNGDLAIYNGEGVSAFWGISHFGPRIFNGDILYCGAAVGEQELIKNRNVELFPNPVKDFATIKFPENFSSTGTMVIAINDMPGKKVMEFSPGKTGSVQFDCRKLSSGLYYYSVYDEGVLKAKGKLIKE